MGRMALRTASTVAAIVILLASLLLVLQAPVGAPERAGLEVKGHMLRAAGGKPKPSPTPTPSPTTSPTPPPAAGWAGEKIVGTSNTWEPSIAADPSGPYVYVMYNRFDNGAKACNNCPSVPMKLRVSSDNGATWGAETFPCPCPNIGTFQYDPVMKVANNGTVYATWMNKYDMVFAKSSNHGATWTAPIEVSGTPWGDHPWIGVSANGTDVYIGYATASDVWVAASHNAGASFAPAVKLNSDTGRYRYPNGLEVLPNGTAVLAQSSYPTANSSTGPVDIETWRSTDGGVTWTRKVIQTIFTGKDFESSSTTALASDAAGTLVALYSGATTLGGNGHVWSSRSTDSGLTWSAPVELGNGTANASWPAITGGASGDFRIHYADDRGGAWNTWYRTSTNGGTSWSAETDISDAATGATYKTAAGFASPYGDYTALDITNTGKTVAAWGEGASFSAGPGAIWVNRQT